MRKKLLLLFTLAVTSMMAKAGPTFTYGISSDEINGVGSSDHYAGTNYSAAIEVPAEMAQALKGDKVTAVSIGFSSGLNKYINVYLTYDLEGTPFYTQEAKVSVNKWVDVDLTTPYEIEGKPFYIGYTYRKSSSTGNPIGFDGQDHCGMGAFSHLGIWADGGKAEWGVYPQFGSLNIKATIEGDKKPENSLVPFSMNLPMSAAPGWPFDYTVGVYNFSETPATSMTVSSRFGNSAPEVKDVDFDSPLGPGKVSVVNLKGVTAEDNGELPVAVSVTKVNGNDNIWAQESLRANLVSSEYISPRVIVIEEATGTGCGWCPAGFVALEQMREKYPGNYIGIAVHNYTGDPLRCSGYEDWLKRYISGYPNATINRDSKIGIFKPSPAACESNYQALNAMVNIKLNVEASYTSDSKDELTVTTRVGFGNDIDSHQYGFALVQTEDNVGPYRQSNNYAGGALGEMGGFENLPNPATVYYNDVAREIIDWNGTGGNLPEKLEGRKTYTYTAKMPIKAASEQKHDDTYVIALLIDRSTNEIVTAAKCKITGTAGVDNIAGETTCNVKAVAGGLTVEGDFTVAEVYNLYGHKMANLYRGNTVQLPAGIYIVKVNSADGFTTTKVIVK